MEAAYTANKNMLPKKLFKIMQESFKRSEEYLYLETYTENQETIQKEIAQMAIENTTPEQVKTILEALDILKTNKTFMVSAQLIQKMSKCC